MDKTKRMIRIIFLISSYLLFMSVSCSSNPPAPREWFNTRLEIDETEFPPGVDFRVERNESPECLNYHDSIQVFNSSSTPLFFEVSSDWTLDNLDEPCPDENLCLKVADNQAWQWGIVNHVEGPPWEYGWELVDRYGKSENLVLWLSAVGINGSDYQIIPLEIQYESGYGGDRPDNVSIPESQNFRLPYIYGEEELSVGVTLSYSINECYPSSAFYNPSSLSFTEQCALSFILLLVFISSIVAIANLNTIKNERNKAS